MSAYGEYETEFTNATCLVAALKDLGYTNVEQHAQAVPLEGYQGDARTQQAHVVVRRRYVGGAANDVGFERLLDGRFVARISEFDRRCHFTQARLGTLTMHYAKHRLVRGLAGKYTAKVEVGKAGGLKIKLKARS